MGSFISFASSVYSLIVFRDNKKRKKGVSRNVVLHWWFGCFCVFYLFIIFLLILGVIPHIHRYLMSKKGQPAPAQKQGPA